MTSLVRVPIRVGVSKTKDEDANVLSSDSANVLSSAATAAAAAAAAATALPFAATTTLFDLCDSAYMKKRVKQPRKANADATETGREEPSFQYSGASSSSGSNSLASQNATALVNPALELGGSASSGNNRSDNHGSSSSSSSSSSSNSDNIKGSNSGSSGTDNFNANLDKPLQQQSSFKRRGQDQARSNTGPQVEFINGKIMLRESSLVVQDSTAEGEYEEVVEGIHATATYFSFLKRRSGFKWGFEETWLFYKALRQCGTEFSLMQSFFPGRTRKQLKHKFIKCVTPCLCALISALLIHLFFLIIELVSLPCHANSLIYIPHREEREHPELVRRTLDHSCSIPMELDPFTAQYGAIAVDEANDAVGADTGDVIYSSAGGGGGDDDDDDNEG